MRDAGESEGSPDPPPGTVALAVGNPNGLPWSDVADIFASK